MASSSASRRRVVARTLKNNDTSKEVSTQTQENINVCPVEKVITGKFEDDGNFVYYNGKEVCSAPENASAHQWDSSLKAKYPKGSVKENEAYYFECEENYILKIVNKERICVSVLNTCPLNVVLEKSDNKFLSPETGEVCELPVNSKTRLTKAGENNRADIEDSSAYIAECNANKYSDVMEGSNSDLHFQCKACPAGFESPVGSKSKNECVDPNAEKEAEEAKLAQELSDKRKTLRIKKVDGTADDYTCIDGWTNNWDLVSGKLAPAKIMDADGVIKNTVDRVNYGKNKVGCPIKSDIYLYAKGVTKGDFDFNEFRFKVDICKNEKGSSFSYLYHCNHYESLEPKVGLLRYKMASTDIDNTAITGWTSEEVLKWNGEAPVIGVYYPEMTCSGDCKVNGPGPLLDHIKKGGQLTASNLFKYFD